MAWGKCLVADSPIDMILYCPNCGMQHIDQPNRLEDIVHWQSGTIVDQLWTNPPHRSHLCRKEDGGCGCVWRPADVPTNGVAELKTRGKADTWPAVHNEEVRAMTARSHGVPAAHEPDCTAPDCDCEPGIECAARGAARGVKTCPDCRTADLCAEGGCAVKDSPPEGVECSTAQMSELRWWRVLNRPDVSGVGTPADDRLLDCWESRERGGTGPICEPCNTGNRAGCLYKRKGNAGVGEGERG